MAVLDYLGNVYGSATEKPCPRAEVSDAWQPADGPACPRPGTMTLGAHPDKIAAWCGTWYDYLRPGTGCRCNTSVLFPSAELIEQHRQMGATPAQLAAMGRHDERRRDDTYIEALATELAEVLGDGVRRSLGGLPLM